MATQNLLMACKEGTVLSLIEANWHLMQMQVSISVEMSSLLLEEQAVSNAKMALEIRLGEFIQNASKCNEQLSADAGPLIQLFVNANVDQVEFFTPLLEKLQSDFSDASAISGEYAKLLQAITARTGDAVSVRLKIHEELLVAGIDSTFQLPG